MDPIDLQAIETQVSEFGQSPKQLFTNPHPQRYCSKLSEVHINVDEIIYLKKNQSIENSTSKDTKTQNIMNNKSNIHFQ